METPISEKNNEEWVLVKDDTTDWIQELADMLTENNIPLRVTLAPGCSAGQCGCRHLLHVAKEDAQTALVCIEEYYMTLHPEIRESQEWADQGRCPACGHHAGADAKECPDCGLLLIIEE